MVKEYIQASKLNKNQVSADETKHFLPIKLPHEYLQLWLAQGYTHIYLGPVKIALTFHGRKCLLIALYLALLDTRFTNYSHAMLLLALSKQLLMLALCLLPCIQILASSSVILMHLTCWQSKSKLPEPLR